MKTDNIRIKRKNSDFLLYGILYLLLILAGIFLIGLPFLSFAPSGGGARTFLVILGIVCVGAGGAMYGMLLYRGICPQDALIITNKGLTNRLVGGKEGVYVEWVNVASMKIFGLSKAPMLGLTLEDTESYLSSLDGRFEKEARANLEVGLPVIAIAQRDIFLSVGELKNLFSRMIKGAISWENYSTQGKKAEEAPADPSQTRLFTPPQAAAAEAKAASTAEAVTKPQAEAVPKAAPAKETPRVEQQTLHLTSEAPDAAEKTAQAQPAAPQENREEIVLLDIDND